MLGFAVYFIPQPVDMNVDNVGGCIEAHLPDMIENHGACNNTARVSAEIFKQRELLLRKLQFNSTAACLAPKEVEFKIGHMQARSFRLVWRASPQESAHTGQHLGDGKRFGEVIIATALETQHTLIDRAPRRKNQHRRADTLSAQAMDQVQPIHVGKCEIDHQRVVRVFHREPFRLPGLRTGIDAEASLGEGPGEKIANCGVVLDY